MAIAYLNHTPIGKSTQAEPYTARAHVYYITRPRHTNYTYSERMPLHRHAVMRFVTKREDAIRKNGRVCDKFIIALPREQSMEQNVDTLRDFGFRLSQGRASFFFSIQDYGTQNPHAHFLFVDADYETGERVAFTSEKGSTARIKDLWAGTVNSHLLENGHEAQIEFGAAQEAVNDNIAHERPETPLEPIPEAVEVAPTREAEVAYIEYGSETLQGALRADTELSILREERANLARLTDAVAEAQREAEKAQAVFEEAITLASGTEQDAENARQALAAYQKADGSLKGVRIALGQWELYKSKTRHNAEYARDLYNSAELTAELAQKAKAEAELQRDIAKAAVEQLDEKRRAKQHFLDTRGTPEELDEAEKDFENTRNVYLEGVDLNRIEKEYAAGTLKEYEYQQALNLIGATEEEVASAKRDIEPVKELTPEEQEEVDEAASRWRSKDGDQGIDI